MWSRRRERGVTKDEVRDGFEKIVRVIRDVRAIYAAGRGNERPPIECPWCGNQATGYSCAWNYNKHVHFKCEHCGHAFML
jgi:transposase-like protein